MACFVVYPRDLTQPQVVPLDRRVIRIGSAPDNEIVLPGPGVQAHHAFISFDQKTFSMHAADGDGTFIAAGKARKTHKLGDGDIVLVDEHILRFSLRDLSPGPRAPQRNGARPDNDRFRALHRFARKLMAQTDVDTLLAELLDELIALSGADKAFLLLTLDGPPRVHVSRNVDRAALDPDSIAVSDSIVQRVLQSGEPLIVADALSDAAFRNARSVMRLKVSSVMGIPLTIRGQTLGLIYLGNDNAVAHFTPDLLDVVAIFAAEAALILEAALARRELQTKVEDLTTEIRQTRFGEIIGACDAMRDIYKKIAKIASTDISVLIEGETGTGKELVARAIHQRSNRADGPFVVINCGAIPENLLESELFGHVRGAFTGAIATVQGKFQAAHKGTLFLDEIGEMPLPLQVKLLRVLQERVVTKVGDTRAEPIDIRVVAATNQKMAESVREGRFREDLFYRLNVVNLMLPPLRERGDDILVIARWFIGRHGPDILGPEARDRLPTLGRDAVAALRRWAWPGNIRELENRIRKAIVFCEGHVITAADLDLPEEGEARILPLAEAREVWQREYINKVLALNDGNRSKTARDLDVDPRTIFRHLEKERGDGDP
jgi:transcriptional regulator with GAF, ATPase, and Fis domain